MHTFEYRYEDHPDSTDDIIGVPEEQRSQEVDLRIHHNGDYSGTAIIVFPFDFVSKYDREPWGAELKTEGDRKHWEVRLPAEFLAAFSADVISGRIVGAIESLDLTKEPYGQTL
jgi:hypothetical protein